MLDIFCLTSDAPLYRLCGGAGCQVRVYLRSDFTEIDFDFAVMILGELCNFGGKSFIFNLDVPLNSNTGVQRMRLWKPSSSSVYAIVHGGTVL